jgi:hypothetical protein
MRPLELPAGRRANTAGTKTDFFIFVFDISGTHKVSGKPEHKDQGYLLPLPGSKLEIRRL